MISLFINELPLLSSFNDRDKLIVDTIYTQAAELSTLREYVFGSALVPSMTATSLVVTNLSALSATFTNIDVTNYELSGFTVTGPITADSFGIVSGTTSNNGIRFGTDVNLYRSAANTLKTDDGLVAASLDIDNIDIDGNTISSTNTNGDIFITPNGDGDIVLDGQLWPRAVGSNNQILTVSNNSTGQLQWVTVGSGGGGVGDVSFVSALGTPSDNALVKFDSTTGKLIQKTDVIVSDTNNITGINNLTINGTISGGSFAIGSTDNVITQSTGALQTRSINDRVWNTASTFLTGAPTTNRILRLTSLNTVGDSNLIQDAGNRIGINTPTPSTGHMLTVIGGITGTNLDIDNIDIDGNTISSTNTNGDIIVLPNGIGRIVLDNQNWPISIGTNNQILTVTDSSNNQLGWVTSSYFYILTANTTPAVIPSSVGLSMSGLPYGRSYVNNLLPNRVYRLTTSLFETGVGGFTNARLMLSGDRSFSVIFANGGSSTNVRILDITNGYPFSRDVFIITDSGLTTNCVVGVSALNDSTFVDTFNLGSIISNELTN
jgi:hypothetical protein